MDASGTTTFEWDYENRLKRVTKPNGVSVAYRYDALGRRIERAPSTGVSTKFTYDGADVLLDQNSDGTTVSYLNGLGIDTKLRQTANGTTSYFLADHLGSTNALVNTAGTITSQTAYDSFGNQTAALATRYGYTGRERDDVAGLLYYRARWYSPELGRFISEDPIGFAGGDINLFAYVKNNPLNFIDPEGTCDIPLKFKQKCASLLNQIEGLVKELAYVEDHYNPVDDFHGRGTYFDRKAGVTKSAQPGGHYNRRVMPSRKVKYNT